MGIKDIRYGLMIGFALVTFATANGQSGWDWRDPNDVGLIDFGDNKVIGYNFVGLGLVSLFDKDTTYQKYDVKAVGVTYVKEYNREPLSSLLLVDGRVGRSVRRYLDWGGGMRLYAVGGDDIHTSGVGGYAWFTWHIIKSKNWRLSYDNGVGPNYFLKPFPTGGTRFNFTTHYGISLSWLMSDKWCSFQLTNIHISNADIKGRERNKALDGIGVTLRYQW